jgi:threonine/homoserine/homoserine lactone efflux protein
VGGLFLLYLAYGSYQSWRAFHLAIPDQESGNQQSVLKAALINLLSPGPYIFWSLVTGPILVTGWRETPVYGLSFVVAFYATMILSLSTIILAFGFARQLGPKVNRILLGASAIALFCFGLIQLWLGIKN